MGAVYSRGLIMHGSCSLSSIPTHCRVAHSRSFQVERDSLNSYEVEDDYGEYEEEDETFEEVEYDDSPVNEDLPTDFRRRCDFHESSRRLTISPCRDPRYTDYVNLSDFCRVQDAEDGASSTRHIYSDITRATSEQPEPPKHKPCMQWVRK